MPHIFEELDFQNTPLGEISLRKRSEPRLDDKLIYEVKMNEEFLMSSLFVEAEVQLSRMGLAALGEQFKDKALDVVVGGLGLGHTALAALENPLVKSLKVIDIMQPVIEWHEKGLVPLGDELMADSRCEFVLGDFFAIANADTDGFGVANQDKKVDAVLLDIDHSPSFLLAPGNAGFYTEAGLSSLANKITKGGVFALWSDVKVSDDFIQLLESVFVDVESHLVAFPNPYTNESSSNYVYTAIVH